MRLPSPLIQRPHQIALGKCYPLICGIGISSRPTVNRIRLHCHNQRVHGPLHLVRRAGQINGSQVSRKLVNLWQIASRAQDGCLCSVVCRADTIRSVSGLAQSGQDQSHQHCDDCENDNDRAAVHGGIEPERQISGKIPSIRLLLFVTPCRPFKPEYHRLGVCGAERKGNGLGMFSRCATPTTILCLLDWLQERP